MELIKEYYEEESDKYVYEFNATEEEKENLRKLCEEYNLTLDELFEKIITNFIDHPEEALDFAFNRKNREKGTPGKPKFQRGDTVGFFIKPYESKVSKYFEGTVDIVDSYGTFEQNEEPSYDVMIEDFCGKGRTLVKHIRESECYDIKELK